MANSFVSADAKKTLPRLGFIEYGPKDQVSLKAQSHQQIRRMVHRPVEPAGILGTWTASRIIVSWN
jgi:hypothetical protein